MHRRQFIAAAAAGVSLVGRGQSQAAGSAATPQRPPPSPTMHLGTQQGPTTAEMLNYFKRHGVEAVCGYPPTSGGREYWTRQELEQTRDLSHQHGIALEMVALPLLSSSHIDRERRDAILLAQDPERTRDIEQIGQMIAACAQAGIPTFKYNLSLTVPRYQGAYDEQRRCFDQDCFCLDPCHGLRLAGSGGTARPLAATGRTTVAPRHALDHDGLAEDHCGQGECGADRN